MDKSCKQPFQDLKKRTRKLRSSRALSSGSYSKMENLGLSLNNFRKEKKNIALDGLTQHRGFVDWFQSGIKREIEGLLGLKDFEDLRNDTSGKTSRMEEGSG